MDTPTFDPTVAADALRREIGAVAQRFDTIKLQIAEDPSFTDFDTVRDLGTQAAALLTEAAQVAANLFTEGA